MLSSHHRFSFPWYFYFCSWATGEPHHSGFKPQIVALSLWCVMFLVRRFFAQNLLNVVLVFFQIFLTIIYSSRGPNDCWLWQSISCSTFAVFLYLEFYILISSQPAFVLLLLLLLLV
jgi:hypothetical protein